MVVCCSDIKHCESDTQRNSTAIPKLRENCSLKRSNCYLSVIGKVFELELRTVFLIQVKVTGLKRLLLCYWKKCELLNRADSSGERNSAVKIRTKHTFVFIHRWKESTGIQNGSHSLSHPITSLPALPPRDSCHDCYYLLPSQKTLPSATQLTRM